MEPTETLDSRKLVRILKENTTENSVEVSAISELAEGLLSSEEGERLLVEIAARSTALCITLAVEVGSLHAYMMSVMEDLEVIASEHDINPASEAKSVGCSLASLPSQITLLP